MQRESEKQKGLQEKRERGMRDASEREEKKGWHERNA